VATPSQQTNQILDELQALRDDPSLTRWSALEPLLLKRREGLRQNRAEFESKAQGKGPAFQEQAAGRMQAVVHGFEAYEAVLEHLTEAVQRRTAEPLEALSKQLQEVTVSLFEALDSYAAFYFSWGENQSPLVTMIRNAVESYSRSALQSTQAQRILRDMEEHFKSAGPVTEENPPRQEERPGGTS
jgi:hypothetical protein